ncbi:hypothetical protein [Campylobacter gracilis]|uniref:Four helix bundle protein n=1 Tax=Campylobacter gracilis RM3268 TaxID=553220 RepID=C8PII7_9BACT|nr:hypothetical protein [Campylobacter gracilis]EEV17352.1 hypothetical protein CAMGR0001_1647 [Campylobacter gracilis RM3268]
MVAHVLHFSFSEIMDLNVNEYHRFLKISQEILKASAGSFN